PTTSSSSCTPAIPIHLPLARTFLPCTTVDGTVVALPLTRISVVLELIESPGRLPKLSLFPYVWNPYFRRAGVPAIGLPNAPGLCNGLTAKSNCGGAEAGLSCRALQHIRPI